jgi:hypothetical protein
MAITLNGTTGIQNVLGSAASPAESNTTNSNTGMYFPTSTTLGFSTAGTNAVYIDASQNVGIGVTAPQEKLEVKTATSTQILVGAGAGFTYGIGRETVNGYLRFYGNQTTAVGYIFTGVDGERMRINSSGNVGIGTSSPNTRLQVYKAATSAFTGTSAGALLLTDSSNTLNYFTSIDFNTTNAPSVPYARIGMSYTSGGSTLSFGTSNSYASGITNTAMTILPGSEVLIATTSTASFPYTGTLYIGDRGAGDPLQIYRGTTAAAGQIGFNNPNGRVGEIYTDTSTTVYNTVSDYRLKENVQPMANALSTVAQLKPVTYKWKVDGSDGQGFIAHELQEVVSDCVSGTKDAVDADGKPVYQGVDTSFLVATLTAAIQEQQALITQLTDRIAALETK